jgi:hypothetical protein
MIETYRHIQVWPFGYGKVISGAGIGDAAGVVVFAAIPDDMLVEGDWRKVDVGGEVLESVLQLGGPAMVMQFKDRFAVDDLIMQLGMVKKVLAREED